MNKITYYSIVARIIAEDKAHQLLTIASNNRFLKIHYTSRPPRIQLFSFYLLQVKQEASTIQLVRIKKHFKSKYQIIDYRAKFKEHDKIAQNIKSPLFIATLRASKKNSYNNLYSKHLENIQK